TQRKLTDKTIDDITSIYHAFRNHEKKAIRADGAEITYEDKQGFWKVATLKEIRAKDYNLTPASYVGVAHIEVDVEPFEEKMERLTKQLSNIRKESRRLDESISVQLLKYGWKID
ncbi:MAG: N-6 DNA methylase, partial [Clostridium sp.]|nr:N-6 DNA methylase [Clostridium sp.]